MSEQEMQAEYIKCLNDMRYFYNTYWTINGEKVSPISQEQWDRMNVRLVNKRNRAITIMTAIKNKR